MADVRPILMIIDDDPLITDTLHFVLSKYFDVSVAESLGQAKSLLQQLDSPPALALVDLGLPPTPHNPEEGFKVISALLAHSPTVKIHVLSGQNDDANIKRALSLGALDFIAKPCDIDQLKGKLLSALVVQDIEVNTPATEESKLVLLGNSLPMQALRTTILQFADSPFPVLIEGESGCGKELIANNFHTASKRAEQPYLSINCASISPQLAESILFGHIKGSFTGAITAQSGYFEDAADGTLFLDEVGELPLELQAKLLRVLENGEFQRVGETHTRKSRARIVAATNRNLRTEVREGRFRADLYHRLTVFVIQAPPLRDLGADRHILRDHFTRFYAEQIGQTPFILDEEALSLWMDYHFPGNVRELRNIVIRLIAKYAGKTISDDALSQEFDLSMPEIEEGALNLNDEASMTMQAKRHIKSEINIKLDSVLKTWERAYLEAAMQITQGNLSQAAKLLGVNRTTLYSRMNTLEEQ
jgi:DNA-binding NtrC family response regulator